MDIRIDEPWWLLLLIPLSIYMGYTWITSGNKLNSKESILFAIRCTTLLALVIALTLPYVTLMSDEEQVLFLVDRSHSVETVGPTADEWIAESLNGQKSNQSVGLYSFAEAFRTETPLTSLPFKVPPIEAMEIKDSTNIAKALGLATALADRKKATRIVLFSDGLETSGDVEKMLPKYDNGQVTIDTVLMERKNANDASISLFETPTTAFAGEKQLIRVEVESSSRTVGELNIFQNDALLKKESVMLEKGKNTFSFQGTADGEGLLKYEAKLIVVGDSYLENNKMLSVTMISQSPHILVVETERNPSIIPSLLDSEAMTIDVINAKALPQSLSGYLGYGAIIFDNVPGHAVGEDKMKVIEQAVKTFGTGFMMVGGEESFGLGGYFKSPIERLLPVEMEVKGKEQLPSLGLIIVLDRSGSMAGSKIVLAREAAARSVELLRDDDTFGFTAFDDAVWEVIPVGPLGNRQEAIDQILSVPAGGGTDIFPGVEKSYEDLADLNLQRKHIILLTDGQSEMPPGYEQIIEEGKKNKTTMSTVAIGSDADWTLLEELAELGDGRFYDVVDESTVPAILSRETSMMTRTYIEDDPFYMTLGGVEEWSSLFKDGIPEMNAYIATTVKNTATLVAKSPKDDPIVAEWMYGLGRTVAYTSDSTGKWSGDLARWGGYADFWNTAVSRLLPSYDEVPYIITHERGGTYTVTDTSRKAAFIDVAIVDEEGSEIPFQSEPIAPGKTRVTVDANPGLVFFAVSDDKGGLYEAGVSVPYSDEYKAVKPNQALLTRIAEQSGGKVLKDPSEAFRNMSYKSETRTPITQWLILFAMLLFFIDITLRRFGMFIGFIYKKTVVDKEMTSGTSAEETMAELLKAKRKR